MLAMDTILLQNYQCFIILTIKTAATICKVIKAKVFNQLEVCWTIVFSDLKS